MFTRIADFKTDFSEEMREAQKNWDALTDASLTTCPAPGYFSIGEHLWHLVETWAWVFKDIGEGPDLELPESRPDSAAELAKIYKEKQGLAINWFGENWTDATLAEELELWGMKFTKGKLLWEMLKHEVHHRGQIVALMRMAGLPVHGVYGPSKEEAAGVANG